MLSRAHTPMQACHGSSTDLLRLIRVTGVLLWLRLPSHSCRPATDRRPAAHGERRLFGDGPAGGRLRLPLMHVLGAEAAEDSKWGALLPEEINPRVDELNALIDQLRNCAVVPLRMPREPSHFEPDGLHLSEHTGYPVLLAQLAAHVPPLASNAK